MSPPFTSSTRANPSASVTKFLFRIASKLSKKQIAQLRSLRSDFSALLATYVSRATFKPTRTADFITNKRKRRASNVSYPNRKTKVTSKKYYPTKRAYPSHAERRSIMYRHFLEIFSKKDKQKEAFLTDKKSKPDKCNTCYLMAHGHFARYCYQPREHYWKGKGLRMMQDLLARVCQAVVAVAELYNFRPPMAYADEIIEHVFLKSLNASKPEVIEAAVANSTSFNVSSAELIPSELNESLTNTSANVSSTSTEKPKEIHGNLLPIFKSKGFRVSEDKRQYLQKHCDNITWDNINEIALKTVKQFDDPTYLTLRKYRLTASTFGTILKAIRRNSFPPSLYKKLLGFYSLNKVPAVQWGKFHESSALDTLRNLYPSWNIKQAGLYLHESGLLGASPDGITDECVIEIKCPYRFRRGKNLEEFLLPETKYIISRSANGAYYANPSHEYYDQIQAEILFSRRQYGVLFIWTPNEAKLFRIEKDPSWAKNVDLILDFYINKYVPYVINLKKSERKTFYMTKYSPTVSNLTKNENKTFYVTKFEHNVSNLTKNENETEVMTKFEPNVSNLTKNENETEVMTKFEHHESSHKKDENEMEVMTKCEPDVSNFEKNEKKTEEEVSGVVEEVPRAQCESDDPN